MAHHQGMSLAALGSRLTGDALQRRFRADPLVASAELLLQERVPRNVVLAHPNVEEVEHVHSVRELPPPGVRSYPTAHTPVPATHFLSNGTYSVMVTNSGGGYSRFEGLEVTRYREDVTRDCWGTFFYLKDIEEGRVWSAAYQPVGSEPDDYHVVFSTDKAEYRRTDGVIETTMEVAVSPEDDVETRRLTVTNHGRSDRTVEVTSYFEASLAAQGADAAHRAFSNLFVETSVEAHTRGILFTRRPRSSEEERFWGMHVLAADRGTPPGSDTGVT
jgi:cyclic beta-1,2-glucan synthetase